MFVGRKYSEEKLLGFAYAFEQITNVIRENKIIAEPVTELSDLVNYEEKL